MVPGPSHLGVGSVVQILEDGMLWKGWAPGSVVLHSWSRISLELDMSADLPDWILWLVPTGLMVCLWILLDDHLNLSLCFLCLKNHLALGDY